MKAWISRAVVAVTALLVSGCLLAPQVAQLQRMKQNRLHGALQSNSRESIACSSSDAVCYQLHLIKGDACSRLATQEADLTVRRNLDSCAADNLLDGTTLAPTEHTPVGDMHEYRLKRLEVLRDLIDTRHPGEPSGADTLAKAAQDFLGHYAGDPLGTFYLASARLTVVEDDFLAHGYDAAFCTSLSDIEALAPAGGVIPETLQAQYHNLSKSIADLRRTGGCT
jgi:hypothetical protein